MPLAGSWPAGRLWSRVPWVLVWLGLLALATHKLFSLDIWWQLAAGEWIVGHGIPQSDPFSFAFPGREWIEPRWLWCLLVHGVVATLGFNALIVLKLVLLVAVCGVLLRAAGPPLTAFGPLGLTLVLATAHERFMVRPELLSFLALALVLLCVQRYKRGGSAHWIHVLPLLQVIWCNAHTLWILGPVMLWIVVAAEWLEGFASRALPDTLRRTDTVVGARLRRLAAVAVLVSLATLVTPYFVRGVLFPFQLFEQISAGHFLNEAIGEFKSPFASIFFGWNYRTLAWLAVVAVSAAGFSLTPHRISWSRAALWAAFLVLSVKAQRNVALFGLVAAWATMLNLEEYAGRPSARWASTLRVASRAAVVVYLAMLIPLVATDRFYQSQHSLRRFGFGISEHQFPVRALAFAEANRLPRPRIHALGDGGYVLFHGGERSAYVDGRLEVYGAEVLEPAIRLTWDGTGLDAEAERTGAGCAIVVNDARYRGLLAWLERAPHWVPVYYDALHVVYLRVTPETHGLATRLAIDWSRARPPRAAPPAALFPPDWLAGLWPRARDGFADERLGALFVAVGQYERGMEHFEAALREAPRNVTARLHLGLFQQAVGREDEGARLLRGVPSRLEHGVEGSLLAGQLQAWAGRDAEAVASFERALRLGAPETETSIRLARAAIRAGELDRADEVLGRVVATGGDGVHEAWNLLAVIAVRRDMPRRAAEAFEASLRIESRQLDVCRTLAGLYERLGDDDRARELRELALRLATDSGS